MAHPIRRFQVPCPNSVQQRISQPGLQTPGTYTVVILLAHLPGIAHRRKAIAHMGHARPGLRRFRHAVAHAHHQLRIRKPPSLFHHRRKNRQQAPVITMHRRQSIQPTGHNPQRVNRRGGLTLAIEQRMQRGTRHGASQHIEALLAPAQSCQPVMYQHHTFAHASTLQRSGFGCTRFQARSTSLQAIKKGPSRALQISTSLYFKITCG